MYTILETKTGITTEVADAEAAEAITYVAAGEIEWAIEEFGRCDTLDHTITLTDDPYNPEDWE